MKRILGPSKKKKSSPEVSRPQSRSSQNTDISEPKSLNFHWKDEDEKKRGGVHDGSDSSGRDSNPKDAVSREASPVHEEHVNGMKIDSG